MPPESLNRRSLAAAAKELSDRDPHLCISFEAYGTPPLWDRPQGFATLLQIILEQQVSLASAKACFEKLSARVRSLTPETLLESTDVELRADGFSRQKAGYARHLAESIIEKRIDLESIANLADDEAKLELIKLKGIGEWTSDIYLLMALGRPDVMPKGDLALHIAWHKLSGEPRPTSDEFLQIAERWRPYRSVASRLLWHYYLSEPKNGRKG
jgi:DNA-3-methyladenine glycosylase II